MKRALPNCAAAILLLAAAGCASNWNHEAGLRTLPEMVSHDAPSPSTSVEYEATGDHGRAAPYSRRVTLTLPDGWSSVMRGGDFLATTDGVFLQHILIERIHVDQVDQSDGAFPLNALSSKLWPIRTVKHMTLRFAPDSSPAAEAEVILASRAANPGLTELRRGEVALLTFAGRPGFRTTFEFKLDVQGRRTPYRTLYYGFMREGWFYGISYTAASRYYFQKDAATFDAILQTFRLADP